MLAAAKKRRGATAIRKGDSAFPLQGLGRLPVRPALVLCAIVLVSLAFILPDNEDTQSDAQLNIAQSPASGTGPVQSADADTELWQVSNSPAQHDSDSSTMITPENTAIEPAEQPWLEQTVKRGDNLSLIFQRAGYGKRDVHHVVTEAEHGKTLARIFPGQTVGFQADAGGNLLAVRYVKSPLETIYYRKGEQGFSSTIEARTPEVRESWATGEITSSLFMAGQDAGLSQTIIMEMANIFGGVIDFVLDPRRGDTIHLIYEELYLDGEKYGDGDIIAASFTNQGTTYSAFRYADSNGDVNYYNEDGVSMRKAFLMAPVDFTRISSNFNMRRLHPIYKTTRPHRGTDYAAPTGTPVFAAGDGRVIKAGYTRANGNYVFIQHGEQYVTRYLHLHKRKVKQGQRVAQSQVIGTVGSTGAATGPHLHYEFLMNGVHRDPRKIHKQLPKAKTLPKSEMASFKAATNQSSTQLASLRADNHLAMSSSETLDASTN